MVAWVFGVTFVCRKDRSATGKYEMLNVSYSLVRSVLPRRKKSFIFPFLGKQKVLKPIIHLLSSCSV